MVTITTVSGTGKLVTEVGGFLHRVLHHFNVNKYHTGHVI